VKMRIWRLIISAIVALLLSNLGMLVATASAQGAWYAEYFSNRDLAGAPTFTRYDDVLRFDWGTGGPGLGVPEDNFSVRWTRDEWFEAGTYHFSYRSDDGIRIWVGDTLVVDDWRDRQAAWSFSDHYIPRGTHTVRVEYCEGTGAAVIEVTWDRAGGGDVWRGEYYTNRDLSGPSTLVRYDPAIDFDWGAGSPDGSIPADNFSVRWARSLGFSPGNYRFYASCDDGVRIFVDGNLVVDAWQDQKQPNTISADIYLGDGLHSIVVEYYEHGGQASAHVWWDRLGGFSAWQGRYYANTELRGGPALIRDDVDINFEWGEGAPVNWMPADGFSVVWMRQVNFPAGYYRFNARSDDGIRVWLDGALVMDYWQPMDYEWHYLDDTYLEGLHTLKVEYYEGGGGARVRFWWERSGTPAPPSAPTPAPTPAPGLPGPWQGEYFNNRDLSGTSVLVRSDSAVDFNWGWEAPAPGVNRDNFSVRWSGTFPFESGRYRFTTTTDDGVRLYVDERPVINSWRPMRGYRTGYVTLSAGNHTVRVEYFERSQAAKARVTWQRIGVAPALTATPGLVAPSDQAARGPWNAAYYANRDLSGSPALTRQDAALDFNWDWGSPDPAVPVNNFSVVWTCSLEFGGGRYTFTTYSDDGVRLYVDDQLVIDSWRPMRGIRTATLDLTKGTHTIRLEYFERTGIALARLTWHLR